MTRRWVASAALLAALPLLASLVSREVYKVGDAGVQPPKLIHNEIVSIDLCLVGAVCCRRLRADGFRATAGHRPRFFRRCAARSQAVARTESDWNHH